MQNLRLIGMDKGGYFNTFLLKILLKQKVVNPTIIPQEMSNNIQPPIFIYDLVFFCVSRLY